MIRILFHIDTLVGGGAEKVLCNLVNHMDQREFDITVQTIYPIDATKHLNNGIHYKSIYPINNAIYQTLYRVEAALGLVYPLHMKDNYDIEIAYLEFGPTKIIASSTNRQAKKIAWVHCDFDIAIKDKQAFVAKAVKQYNQYDKIVCVSEKCKESYISLFGNDPEVIVIHNVIDEKEIIEKAEQPLPSIAKRRKLTLCTVGRFSPPKNFMRLLKSADRLHADYDFDLWIIGDGEQREMIEKFIDEHNMNSYVFLFGFQKNPYPFMKAADLLVCSSNYEGFSTFVSEGMIIGKPILTTDCSGMHELLDHYKNGFITENDDETFYQGVKNLLDDFPESPEKDTAFSTEQLTKSNEEFFQSVLL